MSIYFGSQTGTAEGFARTLMEEAKNTGEFDSYLLILVQRTSTLKVNTIQSTFISSYYRLSIHTSYLFVFFFPLSGFDAKTVDMEDFDAEKLKETGAAIFLMATYGEGEPTDNAAAFLKFLKNEDNAVTAEYLSGLRYCVFGLGNRQYEHYNRMGKTCDALLETLGARRVTEIGLGDDDGTLEEDFDAWKVTLWPVMYTAFHPDAAKDVDRSSFRKLSGDDIDVTPAKIALSFVTKHVTDSDVIAAKETYLRARSASFAGGNGSQGSSNVANSAVAAGDKSIKILNSTKHFFSAPHAKILVNRELRSDAPPGTKDVGSTRHIEIDLNNTGVTYQTADNLAILPENNATLVSNLAAAQGYDLNGFFTLEPTAEGEADFKLPFPTPCSVKELLTSYMDIQGLVKYTAMKHIQAYVTDAKQKEWLGKLLHKDNRPAFKAFVEDGGKSLADVLTNELSSARIPIADLIHIATYIQPRYYTISSSSNVSPDVVHITVSITKYTLKNGNIFNGLCSEYLTTIGVSKHATDTVRIYVRPSAFRLPAAVSTPIIMVGPGTGLAPMRALLQEREFQASAAKKNVAKTMKNLLFFGCKNQSVDYIYRDELEAFQSSGVLTALHLAFSRDSAQKVYVQHLISQPAVALELIDLLFNHNAYVYVCGATLMGSDVHAAFVKVLETERGMSHDAASAYVKDLQERGRYVQELWTA